jgi:hypothetical protein
MRVRLAPVRLNTRYCVTTRTKSSDSPVRQGPHHFYLPVPHHFYLPVPHHFYLSKFNGADCRPQPVVIGRPRPGISPSGRVA